MKLDNHEGFNVSEKTRMDIDALALGMGIGKSEVLRDAIREYLKKYSNMVKVGKKMMELRNSLDGSRDQN